MRYLGVMAIVLGGAAVTACGASGGGAENVSLDTFKDSASYAVGIRLAAAIQERNAEVDVPAVLRGLQDALEGASLKIGPEETSTLVQRLTTAGFEAEAQANASEGQAFREAEARREGVSQTESGLLYQVLTPGTGPKPGPEARVRVNYVGTLVDGTEFDRSRGAPAEFSLQGVIQGWSEAVQLMPVGSKYRFVVPPALGYGENGSPPRIPPNATLVFEVELVEIVK